MEELPQNVSVKNKSLNKKVYIPILPTMPILLQFMYPAEDAKDKEKG